MQLPPRFVLSMLKFIPRLLPRCCRRMAFALRGLALVLLFGAAPALTASEWGEQLRLKSGHLLVAAPHMADAGFAHTVVLLIDYGAGGARGVIVNRPTGRDLSADFGDQVSREVARTPLFYGGPLGAEYRLMLTNRKPSGDGAFEVVDGVYFVHGRRLVHGLEQLPASGVSYRVLAGYAGWGRLQLEHEVARGDWFVVPASQHYVLELAPEQLWSELLRFYQAQMAQQIDPASPDGSAGSGDAAPVAVGPTRSRAAWCDASSRNCRSPRPVYPVVSYRLSRSAPGGGSVDG